MNRVAALLAAVLLAVPMAACAAPTRQTGTTSAAPAPASTPFTVAFITHQAPGDTFWDLVRRGAEAAAAKDNVDLQYFHDPDAAGQAAMVTDATGRKVSGIAVTLPNPPVLSASVQAAVSAGVPVVALNTGIGDWRALGALEYIGQDDGLAGRTVGERLTREGAKNVLCVIQQAGHVGLEARCAGAAATFAGTVQKLYVDGTRTPEVKAAIVAELQQDRSIDRVLTLSAPVALATLEAAGEANSYAKVVTFDTNTAVIEAIKRGTISWAVDQQPFLQGYLAVDSLWLYLTNRNVIGGGQPTLTGPSFVDGSNVDEVAERAREGTR
ncbi:MAG: substrate-binding domain-containing protein [Mycobacterium sp.]